MITVSPNGASVAIIMATEKATAMVEAIADATITAQIGNKLL